MSIQPASGSSSISPLIQNRGEQTGEIGSGLKTFFSECAQKMRQTLPEPFSSLPDSFLVFLHFEMSRMALNPETRRVLDADGKPIAGYSHFYHYQEAEDPQQQLKPITLKGVWIPKEALTLYALEDVPTSCPLVRSTGGKQEFLFMIHPESEGRYAHLLEKYGDETQKIPALPLSSIRTLVVSIPGEHGPTLAMVKVSLDKKIGDVKRLLGVKECANSIINAAVFRHKCPNTPVMGDLFSFVPQSCEDGMIFRQIPPVLSEGNRYVVPLYSLFSIENGDFFLSLIKNHPGSPTDFIVEKILKPIAHLFIENLFDHHVSLQIHGQNLLLVIDPESKEVSLLYRDMGGVNALLPMEEREKMLPEALRSEAFFYTKNHLADAAEVLEAFTFKVLFNLEKQFVKQHMEDTDPQFNAWLNMITQGGYLTNWTLPGPKNNDHQREQTKETFYRYGYFSKLFGKAYLDILSNQAVLFQLSYSKPKLDYDHFITLLGNNKRASTNYEGRWFEYLIKEIYGSLMPKIA